MADRPTFGEWLTEQYNQWKVKTFQETGNWPSKKDFADFLGKHPVNVNLWMSGQRIPKDENVYDLAAKLGPDVFDNLGLPEPIPDDPALKLVMQIFQKLSPEDQEKLLQRAQQLASKRDKTDPKVDASAVQPC